ncbi:zinc ribbon domain-containing protein [Hydrococcus rivularis NIES-593]|uniref:Zinc ribbon domain-containing protein n=1 Tax=Hydrococcus rivularis NIES-593 TaxID=1921803 RepID=A0A1U7HMG5_9CYAN|nr:zinc ribbon domain-containing protein [Hydrococcus rivularis]OKH24783.1 zinc ribbon domain-containing protein [Hydrococcus rivularis NIES-593]
MTTCPRCHQSVDAKAVRCPHCFAVLKAYGHPGIPLYQATGKTFLCDSCRYHEDDTCTFPQRPYAKTCTMYRDKSEPVEAELKFPLYPSDMWGRFKTWCRTNKGLLLLIGLIGISILVAIR